MSRYGQDCKALQMQGSSSVDHAGWLTTASDHAGGLTSASDHAGGLTSARPAADAADAADAAPPAFVLSGGGNLGAVQVGMIRALIESGVRPGMIVGTSVGAINGAFLAGRADLDGVSEIARFWSSLRRRDVFGLGVGPIARGLVRPRGYLFDSRPMRRILESFLTFDRLEEAPIPFAVVATELSTGEPVVLSSGDAATALLASSAIPRVLPPVEIGGRLLVDGAASADVPLDQAVALGARNLFVLATARAQVERMQAQTLPGDTDDAPVVHVMPPPDVHVPLGDLSQSRRLLEFGYDQARAWMEGRPAAAGLSASVLSGVIRRRPRPAGGEGRAGGGRRGSAGRGPLDRSAPRGS